jgi:hypothetical protein
MLRLHIENRLDVPLTVVSKCNNMPPPTRNVESGQVERIEDVVTQRFLNRRMS